MLRAPTAGSDQPSMDTGAPVVDFSQIDTRTPEGAKQFDAFIEANRGERIVIPAE